MKDLPHHIKKLNRQVIRSARRTEREDEASTLPSPPPRSERSKAQLRKQAKAQMRKTREEHISSDLTPEQRNRKMKKRVPVFDRTSHSKPNLLGAKPPRKQRSI